MTEESRESFAGEVEDEGDQTGRGGLSESLRKALVTGLSAVMMTEEGIRSALSDMRLPKEAINYLAQQTDRSRKELFRAVSDELKGYLSEIDLSNAVRRALTGLKLELKAEIRFVEDDASESQVKAKITDADESAPDKKRRTKRKS